MQASVMSMPEAGQDDAALVRAGAVADGMARGTATRWIANPGRACRLSSAELPGAPSIKQRYPNPKARQIISAQFITRSRQGNWEITSRPNRKAAQPHPSP